MLPGGERPEGWRRWFPTSWGLKFIFAYNLVVNVAFFAVSAVDLKIFLSPKAWNVAKISSRVTVCGYAAMGLPMLIVGLWGIAREQERPLRLYSYYMVVNVFVNAAYSIDALVHFLPCATAAVLEHPTVFQCGQPRGLMLMGLAFAVTMQLAVFYSVYAYCEDLAYVNEGLRRATGGKAGKDQMDPHIKTRLVPRHMAIAAQWAGLRDGPLSHIQGRLIGEYGAACEVAPLLGGQPGLMCNTVDSRMLHLPPTPRLV